MEEFKAIKQHLCVIDEKNERIILQEVEQVQINMIPLTSVDNYISFNAEVSSNELENVLPL